MSGDRNSVTGDRDLQALAKAVLLEQGYSIEDISSDFPVLLAENPYFLVAVVATSTITQLLVAEPVVEALVTERVDAAEVGAKRWDAYVVLLTQERSPESSRTTRDLFSINYDTRNVRRIAHSGVDATLASVRIALGPFVAPIELDDPELTADALGFLLEALAARGVERELAGRALSAFRQGVPLGDVL